MTEVNQDIKEHFFEGSKKVINVTVYQDEDHTVAKDLTGANVVYVIYDDDNNELIRKDSDSASEVNITNPTNGVCEIYIDPADSIGHYGTHNHICAVIDSNGDEATIFTGRVKIFRSSYAHRQQDEQAAAYLEGG